MFLFKLNSYNTLKYFFTFFHFFFFYFFPVNNYIIVFFLLFFILFIIVFYIFSILYISSVTNSCQLSLSYQSLIFSSSTIIHNYDKSFHKVTLNFIEVTMYICDDNKNVNVRLSLTKDFRYRIFQESRITLVSSFLILFPWELRIEAQSKEDPRTTAFHFHS